MYIIPLSIKKLVTNLISKARIIKESKRVIIVLERDSDIPNVLPRDQQAYFIK